MSDFYTINKVRTIARKLNSQTSGIITIYHNTGNPGSIDLATNTLVSVNSFIKNLKAHAKIGSLAPIKMPNFQLEDSETDKLYKVLDVEWNSPRKQLNLYISDNALTWELIGAISLLNPSGYPYRVYNLMDMYTDNLAVELGENGRLGVEVKDVGYGLLTGDDLVTIHGSYVEEIIVSSKSSVISESNPIMINSCVPYQWNVTSQSQIIITANSSRTYACIVNTSDNPVYLNLGDSAIANQGVTLTGKGSSYEITSSGGLYRGTISAICSSGTTANLTGIVCS